MRTCSKSIIREFNKMGDAFARTLVKLNNGYKLNYRVEHTINSKEEQHVKLFCTLIYTKPSPTPSNEIEVIDCYIQTSYLDGLCYILPISEYQKVICQNWSEVKSELIECCKTAWLKILIRFELCNNSEYNN